ncbi:MAG: protein kinase [Deltaproteobacteria bacterium]|nr:protein kinase [Deltaproteobacteria bacterium]
MTLATTRIVQQGTTPFAHEREAIDFAIRGLPNVDPYHLWALLELFEPASGRLYELDLLIFGYRALYLVEVKSAPGCYAGDRQDWYRTPPGESRRVYMENPLSLANLKAKVLKNRLRGAMTQPDRCPYVEPLIFLSHPEAETRFERYGDSHVVVRDTFLRAVSHHDFPGAGPLRTDRSLDHRTVQDVVRALAAIGLRPCKGKLHVGPYELGEILEEGAGYQDRVATHRDQPQITRRARSYLVPDQTTVARRQQLRRAADRETQLLWELREHPSILRIADYVTDAPLGPTVLFDPFDDALPLDAYLRREPELSFEDRVAILEQVGQALGHCHRKGIVHGALSPQAVLVRRRAALEVRLINFQLGAGREVEATTHWSALAAAPWAVYQAPELREDPSARGPQSDLFSLGAVAYLLLTDQAPGKDTVEVDRRLSRDLCLDPRGANDAIPESVAEAVRLATQLTPARRADDVSEWLELLLDVVTRPEPETQAPELDPLTARKDDRLAGDLTVIGTLGQGATARVLRVERGSDRRAYALKVSLSAEHDERLRHEAAALRELRHPRIVQLVDELRLAGRACLLLSLAGTETLHRLLVKEGTVSLDLAARYGDDLLSALEHLEERGEMHRDLKPANLGVGALGKDAAHLTLFDFSLAGAPVTELGVGTAAYRDPFLRLRGAWDHAAERYSAAVTLHEMLTGVRPTLSGPDGSSLDPEARLAIAAERFEASVRPALVKFFQRALAREVEDRFASARELRLAWVTACQAPAEEGASLDAGESSPLIELPVERLAELAEETAIGALPLSPRAVNALDRAGLLVASELLSLPDNRLSAIRGVGTAVAREILDFRNRWRDARALAPAPSEPFFAGYRGEDLVVEAAGLDASVSAALRDAGLRMLSTVAAAPGPQVQALAVRHGFDVKVLTATLSAENQRASQRDRPTTLEGWLEALLPPRKAHVKHARLLFGLDGETAGRLDLTVSDVAAAEAVTPAAIYIALGKCREKWGAHKAFPELRERVQALVDAAGGAVPLAQAADRLLLELPHDRAREAAELRARAAALLRVVAEVGKDGGSGLRYVRLHDRTPWLFASDGHARAVRLLGEAADRFAAEEVLASPGEVARRLVEQVAESPLAALAPDRLVELAASGSHRAARSTRLELYPRGMAPERALALSASVLASGLSAGELQRRVALRYPDAAPLPDRPELDRLLEHHELYWNVSLDRYEREGAPEGTVLETHYASLHRVSTALPGQPRAMDPEAVAARQFDEQLRSAVERRSFRVLGVAADRSREAALAVGARLGVDPVLFDQRLIAAAREEMRKKGIRSEEIVHQADRARHGPGWERLLKLMQDAAARVAEALLPPAQPLLLVQPGPCARYRLMGFLEALVETGKRSDSAAVLLLVPAEDTGGIPRINGELAIPGVLSSHVLWVSPEWLANKHNAAA